LCISSIPGDKGSILPLVCHPVQNVRVLLRLFDV
jgi:hypothetical protein